METGHPHRSWKASTLQRRVEIAVAIVAVVATAIVYTSTHYVAPALVTHYEHAPEMESLPKRTSSARHRDGDPVNIAAIGSLAELTSAMRAAGWVKADSSNRSTDIAIAKSVIFNRPDSTAPVSPLFLFGRPQDIAFERQVGHSARSRHHARFWNAGDVTHNGRSIWLGDATFDARAGMSYRGLHPTHHIAPDVDQERDTLVTNLVHAGQVAELFTVTGMGVRVSAHNAEGDRFDTDGELYVVVLSPGSVPVRHTDTLSELPVIALKNRVFSWSHDW